MTKHLLADPHMAGLIWGYGGLERILISVFGHMTVQQMSSQIYGLYTGFVYFTPFLRRHAGPDRCWAQYLHRLLSGLVLLMADRAILPRVASRPSWSGLSS